MNKTDSDTDKPECRYYIVPDSDIEELDTSLPGDPLLVCAAGKHYHVGSSAKDVILCMRGHLWTVDELQAALDRKHGIRFAGLQEILDRLCLYSIVRLENSESAAEADSVHAASQRKWWRRFFFQGYFSFRTTVLPQKHVRPLANKISFLFHYKVVFFVLPMLIAVQVFWGTAKFSKVIESIGTLTYDEWICVLLLNYIGLFGHELGHAAACIRSGINHGPIGFGFYIIFPVFYVDVSECWRLPRKDRFLIDCAGIYVNVILATIFLGVYFITANELFLIVSGVYNLTLIINLNPFIRMDGYWMLSDVLGISNLMATNQEMSVFCVNRLFGVSAKPPKVLSIKSKIIKWAYILYYPLWIGFVAYFAGRLIFWYVPQTMTNVPVGIEAIVDSVVDTGIGLDTISKVLKLVLRFIPLFAGTMFLISILRKLTLVFKEIAANYYKSTQDI